MKNIVLHIKRACRNTWPYIILLIFSGCKKMVELDNVQNKTQAGLVFSDATGANTAINGIYRKSKDVFQSPISSYNSLASGELINTLPNSIYDAYFKNQILSTDSTNPWASFYQVIYACNAAIEGLENNSAIAEAVRNQYIGEAKFNRAWCYFYLVNLYGDVPLITSTDVLTSSTASRTAAAEVYQLILSDLSDAIGKLQADYAFNGLGRARVNKWAAVALLSRVNLYLKDWVNAEANATLVINSGIYSLLNLPAGIFVQDNNEAILQWANFSGESNPLASNATLSPPQLVINQPLLNTFEANDLRKSTWIGSKIANAQTYYYAFKFTSALSTTNERYTVLRLGEQYLIRAEARAMQNNFIDAIADVNLVRLKHGGLTTALPIPTTQPACIDLIIHERQVDLFTEGMHRWFDLKRTGRLNTQMLIEKPATWTATAALYPLPLTDIQRDPNLTQNPGYN